MSSTELIPCLPETAPFTPEQRAYLNGFLAGLFSRAPAAAPGSSEAGNLAQLTPITVLFGSQTGNAENLAKRIAREAGKRGFAATVHEMSCYPAAQIASETRLLIVSSTYGDGEPPDNARTFWSFLKSDGAPRLNQMRFSVCALGDSNYPKFCGFGKELDARLQSLGAQRSHERADCDVDLEEPFAKWLDGSLNAFSNSAKLVPAVSIPATASATPVTTDSTTPCTPSRLNPCLAELAANRTLNGTGSAKDTRHFEIAVDDTRLSYEPGDALGVFPSNCPELVAEILRALDCTGEEPVLNADGSGISFRDALIGHYEITRIPHALLKILAERSGDADLKNIAAPTANRELTRFLWGREIIDLLVAHPEVKLAPAEFVASLKKLQPRLYSISSSPKVHAGQIHLTVNVVRYQSLGRRRKGVCSTFLAERGHAEVPLRVFVQPNKNFRLPADDSAPVVMVGPGTGVAPFRAFLEERRCTGAKGKNWLFFGDQHARTDFLYRKELEAMARDGVLTRLETAFSRDQPEKIYIQHRMREQATELFAWLEYGAHVYVCGDASRMAKDVDAALHEVIQTAGGRTPDQAAEYVERLRTERRYQRDVY